MIVLFLCNNLENNLIPNLKLNIIMIENYFIFYKIIYIKLQLKKFLKP